METFGIYTLANDIVFDQLVALLNSIEANIVRINDHELPVSKGQKANFMRSLNERKV